MVGRAPTITPHSGGRADPRGLLATDRRPVCSPRQGPCWRAGQGRARNAAVFISQGDPNKGPHTRAFETADVYGLLVLEARDPRSWCLRPSSLRGSKGGSFFASPGSDGCWQSLAYTCIPTVSACRHRACSPPLCPCPHFLLRTQAFWMKGPPETSMTSS